MGEDPHHHTTRSYRWLLLLILMSIPTLVSAADDVIEFKLGLTRLTSRANVDIRDIRAAAEVWFSTLGTWQGKRVTYTVEVLEFAKLERAKEHLCRGTIDALGCNTLEYLAIEQSCPLMEPTFSPVVTRAQRLSRLLLLTSKAKADRSLLELANTRLALVKARAGAMARVWLDSLLLTANSKTMDQHFKTIRVEDTPGRAILNVHFGAVDCAIVFERVYKTMVELNPAVGRSVVPIKTSPPLLAGLMAVRRDAPAEVKALLSELVLTAGTDARSAQILTLYDIDGFQRFDAADLTSVRQLRQSVLHAQPQLRHRLHILPTSKAASALPKD